MTIYHNVFTTDQAGPVRRFRGNMTDARQPTVMTRKRPAVWNDGARHLGEFSKATDPGELADWYRNHWAKQGR